MERAAGIEPASLAWKARVIPLYDARRIASPRPGSVWSRPASMSARLAGAVRTGSAGDSAQKGMVEGVGFEPT